MSLPSVKQAYAFLTPLKGRTSAFTVRGRKANLSVARFTLGCLAALRLRTLILDTSCFYGTNVEVLTSGLPEEFLRNTTLTTIHSSSELERSLVNLLTKETRVMIIDDLNSLRNILSLDGRSSSMHKLFLLLGILSYEARTRNLSVLTTVYKSTSALAERNRGRSLAATADIQIAAEAHTSSLTLRCNTVKGWPANKFEANVYFALKT